MKILRFANQYDHNATPNCISCQPQKYIMCNFAVNNPIFVYKIAVYQSFDLTNLVFGPNLCEIERKRLKGHGRMENSYMQSIKARHSSMQSIKARHSSAFVPKYTLIQDSLIDAIRDRKYTPNLQLPTEIQLAKDFNVSRMTVQKALRGLSEQGWIYRRQGQGTFVCEKLPSYNDCVIENVAFGFMDVLPSDNDFTLREMGYAEKYLAERRIIFSWAALKTSDLLLGNYSPALTNGQIQGMLLDGYLHDFHHVIAEKFSMPVVAIGNHDLSQDFAQVRLDPDQAMLDACRTLKEQCDCPIFFLFEPLTIHFTKEVLVAYRKAMRQIGQSKVLAFMLEDGNAAEILANLKSLSPDRFAVITSDAFVHDVMKAYDQTGLNPEAFPILAYGQATRLSPQDARQIYFLELDTKEIIIRGTELLLQMIANEQEDTYLSVPAHKIIEPEKK